VRLPGIKGKAFAVIGVRRGGKTSFLEQGAEPRDRAALLSGYVDVLVLRDVIERHACDDVGSDICLSPMSPHDKPVIWLRGAIATPPLGREARIEAGFLMRRLQRGDALSFPHSRPMPDIGSGCHELRVLDTGANWRIIYHLAPDAVVVLDVFAKKTVTTPKTVIAECRKRLAEYRRVTRGQRGDPHASR
jgi:phage-related protein